MKVKLVLTVFISFVTLNGITQNKKEKMEALHYSKMVQGSYAQVFDKVETGLKEVGFGIITQVAMQDKIKAKLDKDIPIYQLLGVCSPKHAYEALQVEDNVGLFLPCKVLIKEKGDNIFEVVSINAQQMMGLIGNKELNDVAKEVDKSLKAFMDKL